MMKCLYTSPPVLVHLDPDDAMALILPPFPPTGQQISTLQMLINFGWGHLICRLYQPLWQVTSLTQTSLSLLKQSSHLAKYSKFCVDFESWTN